MNNNNSNINNQVTDIKELKRLCWNGISSQQRPLAWKILLGYVPTNVSRRESALKRKRRDYQTYSNCYNVHNSGTYSLVNGGKVHSTTNSSSSMHRNLFLSASPCEVETLRQVQMDVPRTLLHLPLFRDERVQFRLERLLYTHACRNPATSYVQGMNDIVALLFAVFLGDYESDSNPHQDWNYGGEDDFGDVDGKGGRADVDMSIYKDIDHIPDETLDRVEADCFYCLHNLVSSIQDHFTSHQPGIRRMVTRLERCLKCVDPCLHLHLQSFGVDVLHFSFRWMNCLLVRELPLPCVARIWDACLSQDEDCAGTWTSTSSRREGSRRGGGGNGGCGFDDFHIYVCAAMLCHFSSKLRAMSSDDELLGFLTVGIRSCEEVIDLMEADVDVWLSQAHVWQLTGKADVDFECGKDLRDDSIGIFQGRHQQPSLQTKVKTDETDLQNNGCNEVKAEGKESGEEEESYFYKMFAKSMSELSMTNLTSSMNDPDFLCS